MFAWKLGDRDFSFSEMEQGQADFVARAVSALRTSHSVHADIPVEDIRWSLRFTAQLPAGFTEQHRSDLERFWAGDVRPEASLLEPPVLDEALRSWQSRSVECLLRARAGARWVHRETHRSEKASDAPPFFLHSYTALALAALERAHRSFARHRSLLLRTPSVNLLRERQGTWTLEEFRRNYDHIRRVDLYSHALHKVITLRCTLEAFDYREPMTALLDECDRAQGRLRAPQSLPETAL